MKTKISIAVLGSTGYVGLELVYLLSKREDISINFLGSENSANKKINLIRPYYESYHPYRWNWIKNQSAN